ncbi:MAG: hypothetical protein QOI92_2896 [Chloroflexota bacterium]|jgi:hypothetical protein|nr:hypothetical protein [Chloroflexota bacterium]
MGLWNRIQRTLWTGEVVKDYGQVSDRSVSGSHRTLTVVLSEKHGRRVFLKESYRRLGAFSVSFIELDQDEVTRLDTIFHDALGQMSAAGDIPAR